MMATTAGIPLGFWPRALRRQRGGSKEIGAGIGGTLLTSD